MSRRLVTVALIQMRCDGSPDSNLEKAVSLVGKARFHGANIVVLPELFQHPYIMGVPVGNGLQKTAESIPGPTTDRLSRCALENGVVLVGGSIVESNEDGLPYNTALCFDRDGTLVGKYRKKHIPNDEGFEEQGTFAPGEMAVQVFPTTYGKVSVQVCFDQWHPEDARAAALMGAEILVYPSAIGDIDHVRFREEHSWQLMWQNVHLGHAAANNIFVAAANRVGRHEQITFWGGSLIVDPSSRLLNVGGTAEQIVYAECDLNQVRKIQEAWGILECARSSRSNMSRTERCVDH